MLKYNLFTAKGMCFWQNRLVLWNVARPDGIDTAYQDDSAHLMFFSEVNDPSYFPYPNNVSAFTEPVLHAVPFGDDLLVITATSMHLVTGSNPKHQAEINVNPILWKASSFYALDNCTIIFQSSTQ